MTHFQSHCSIGKHKLIDKVIHGIYGIEISLLLLDKCFCSLEGGEGNNVNFQIFYFTEFCIVIGNPPLKKISLIATQGVC